jgi:hypothetical protein
MQMSDIFAFEVLERVIGIYCLLLTVIGSVLNMFCFCICLSLIRRNGTFIFMAFFSLSNLVSLFWWNVVNFFVPFFDFDLKSASTVGCKIGSYLQFSSLQISAWFLVIS